jgi:exosortase
VALFSLPFLLFGSAWYLWGWTAARKLAFPFALIFFTIPVPGLTQATNSLQLLASKVAYTLSTALGADIVQAGNNLKSASDAWGFNVSEGCSGIRSLMALTLVSAVYAYLTQKTLWKGLVLFAASVPISIIANALRVTTIILIAEYGNADIAGGIYHDWSGFIFFPLGLAGLILIDKILNPSSIVVRRQKAGAAPVASQ